MNWNLKLKNLSTQQSKNETALGLDEAKNTKGGQLEVLPTGQVPIKLPPQVDFQAEFGADGYLPTFGFYSFAGFTPGSL